MSERVLVALTEAEAQWLAGFPSPKSDESATAQGVKDRVNMALSRNREQQIERVAVALAAADDDPCFDHLNGTGPVYGIAEGQSYTTAEEDAEFWRMLAEAVLSVLEGADDE